VSLGDHGYFFDHGRFSFQTCLRVPLILHYPGVLGARVDAKPVELIHLAPTLLEAAGVKLPGGSWMQGRTLTPRLRGGATEGLAFSEAGWENNNKWQKVARDGRFKLIFAQTRPEQRWIGGEGVRFVLYDLANDPGETKNVIDRFPQDAERLKRALWTWDRTPRVDVEMDAQGGTCGALRPVSRETEELLRSLGYLN
jgi:arylsulfatase